MEFRIADTFTDSLARLTGDEQKSVKTTAFDLQMNPAGAGKSFHKLDRSKDPNFWSVRVSSDLRLIVHKTPASLLLCYVDHHDKAYAWAERRKLETHPRTGAAQLVQIRERVEEIVVPFFVQSTLPLANKPKLFQGVSRDQLLAYGVPEEWLGDVQSADEDTLLDLADHLPAEAAEALLELATGGSPAIQAPAPPGADPFSHPDAQRRFRVMTDVEELERALTFPWEKWAIFLHPAQKQWVEHDYSGPARVSGSAGTGKTIVALHRAVHLARNNPNSRVLLTTFSEALAHALQGKFFRLVSNQPKLAERVDVLSMDAVGERLYQKQIGKLSIVSRVELIELFKAAALGLAPKTSLAFLMAEWDQVVDPWQIDSWEGYRDVRRLGRKTRLPEAQRALIWQVMEKVQVELALRGKITRASMFAKLSDAARKRTHHPYDFAVIDESQDISVPQLRFLSSLGGERPNALFFAGDLGQRIFQQPFSWKSLGVDIRGRSRTLKINYRTSHQIRSQADRLLGPEVGDVDGNIEGRKGTVSIFNGPAPTVESYASHEEEKNAVANWLRSLVDDGLLPQEIGVFVRSEAEYERARNAVTAAGLPFKVLGEAMVAADDAVTISTMHLAKGLEFKSVAVMACDDEVIPSQARIEAVTDDADLEEVYSTERHLLYVACTRARDSLHVSAIAPVSEFLGDLLDG